MFQFTILCKNSVKGPARLGFLVVRENHVLYMSTRPQTCMETPAMCKISALEATNRAETLLCIC